MLQHALAIARAGWSVIPLCERDGSPIKAPRGMDTGTVAQYAERRATAIEIHEWWGGRTGDGWRDMGGGLECNWSRANIGALPGPISGAIVVDFDPRNAEDKLAEMMALAEAGPTGIITVSPRGDGGHHRWYAWDDRLAPLYQGLRGRGKKQLLELLGIPGIDLPWQVVMPPSVHPKVGGAYGWMHDPIPIDASAEELQVWRAERLGAAPEWLLELADRVSKGELLADVDAGEPQTEQPQEYQRIEPPTGGVFEAPKSSTWDTTSPVPRHDWLVEALTNGFKPGKVNDGLTRIAGLMYSHGMHVDAAIAIASHVERLSAVPGSTVRAEETVRSTYRTAYARQGAQPNPPNKWAPQRTWGVQLERFPVRDFFAEVPCCIDFCERSEQETGVPPGVAAGMVLGVSSTSMIGRYKVSPWPGWSMVCALWMLMAIDSGELKSAVFKRGLIAIDMLEKHVLSWVGTDKVRRQRVALLAQLKSKKAKLEKAKITQDSIDELASITLAIEQLTRRGLIADLYTDGGTPESFRKQRLASDGFAILQEEGKDLFQTVSGMYGSKSAASKYIKAYDGSPVRYSTLSRGREFGEACAVPIAMMIQPEILQGLTGRWDGESHQLNEQGFIPRLLFSVPECPPVVEIKRNVPAGQDFDSAAEELGRLLIDIWCRPFSECPPRSIKWSSAIPNKLRPPNPSEQLIIRFDDEAGKLIEDMKADLRARSQPNRELEAIRGLARRAHGTAARVIAVLHQLEHRGTTKPVNAETARRVIDTFERYYIPHAQHAYSLMGAWDAERTARKIWGRYKDTAGIVPRSDVMRAFRMPSKQVSSALNLLAEWGYAQKIDVQSPNGGRPTESYRFVEALGGEQ